MNNHHMSGNRPGLTPQCAGNSYRLPIESRSLILSGRDLRRIVADLVD